MYNATCTLCSLVLCCNSQSRTCMKIHHLSTSRVSYSKVWPTVTTSHPKRLLIRVNFRIPASPITRMPNMGQSFLSYENTPLMNFHCLVSSFGSVCLFASDFSSILCVKGCSTYVKERCSIQNDGGQARLDSRLASRLSNVNAGIVPFFATLMADDGGRWISGFRLMVPLGCRWLSY